MDTGELCQRYRELLDFVRGAGLLHIPLSTLTREPIANLVHLLQSEIASGRISSLEEARASRAKADGFWHICELTHLSVTSYRTFSGEIRVKHELGGEVISFDNNTRAYELTSVLPSETAR